MSLRRAEIAPVPAATAQVAAAAFPKGCPAMRMRDELGAVYDDRMFTSLYPARGQPAHSPWRLALLTVLQFAEGLPRRRSSFLYARRKAQGAAMVYDIEFIPVLCSKRHQHVVSGGALFYCS